MDLRPTTRSMLLLPLVACPLAQADINTVGTMTEQTNEVTANPPSGYFNNARIRAEAPLGTFTHDFGALGGTVWNVTWQAPPGMVFEVEVPPGFDGWQLTFNFLAEDEPEPVDIFEQTEITAIDFVGGSPEFPLSVPQFSLTSPMGKQASAVATVEEEDLLVGERYRFRSVTITFDEIPAEFDVSYDIPVVNFQVGGFIIFSSNGERPAPPDPGQWVRLIPEPPDCNSNGIADDVDIANGTSFDCNCNGVPDECDLEDPMMDLNNDGYIDSCTACAGDANCDGVVNGFDAWIVFDNLWSTGPEGDVNFDGIVNIFDYYIVIWNFGSVCD